MELESRSRVRGRQPLPTHFIEIVYDSRGPTRRRRAGPTANRDRHETDRRWYRHHLCGDSLGLPASHPIEIFYMGANLWCAPTPRAVCSLTRWCGWCRSPQHFADRNLSDFSRKGALRGTGRYPAPPTSHSTSGPRARWAQLAMGHEIIFLQATTRILRKRAACRRMTSEPTARRNRSGGARRRRLRLRPRRPVPDAWRQQLLRDADHCRPEGPAPPRGAR
jgi:hypothetical protein